VEIERGDPRAGPRRQIIGVEIENAGARAIGRAAVVAAAGLELLAERLVGPDFERGLGNGREEARDLRVDRLADRVIARGQRFAVRM